MNKKITKKYKLYLIEDAAEVFGLKYKNKPCGSFGDISILSFYANKHITTGEGDRANLKEATSDNPSLKHFTRNHKLIRKANEQRAVAKNKLDEQFKGFIDENN